MSAKIKTYLSGKYTGLSHEDAIKKFEVYEAQLVGRKVVNPLKLGIPPRASWIDAMEECLIAMEDCTAIALMPDWEESRGARIERQVAKMLKFEIIYLK
jgi:hypothetical protein